MGYKHELIGIPLKNSGWVLAFRSIGADLPWSEFMDPLQYELQWRHMRRASPAEPWGIEVASASIEAVQISAVTDGGIADAADIARGAYIMAINGRRVTNTETANAQLECNRNGIRITFAVKRRVPLDPKAPVPLPACWQRRSESDYLLIR